jgi:hypothetical protein
MQLNYLAPLVSFQDGSVTVQESKLKLLFKNIITLQSKNKLLWYLFYSAASLRTSYKRITMGYNNTAIRHYFACKISQVKL